MRTRNLILPRAFSLLALLLLGPGQVRAELLAGAAKRSIVPPFPTHMGGFMDRKQTFQGVHDEVFARALVIDNGTVQLVVIGSDLTGIDADMTRQIRDKVQEQTGIPGGHVLVSCAHNHSAPSIFQPGRFKESEQPVKAFFVKQFSEAAVEAFKTRKPARLGFRAGQLKGATRNRQQNNDLVDPQVGVLLVQEQESRKVIATLFNFTGHPVIVGSSNLLLSGEFPGAASRAVENLLGGIAIFTQGAAGDVTVNRSGDPFDEVERLGRTLAGEVIKTAGFIQGSGEARLAASSKTLQLSARTIPPEAESAAELERLEAELKSARERKAPRAFVRSIQQKMRIPQINMMVAKARKAGTMKLPDRFDAEVQVLQIGGLILVTIPGEIFVEYALELRARIAQELGHSMCLVGYTNGYIGYIVTPRASQTGGYEASVARVPPDSGRKLTETAMELVRGLSIPE
jgi:hypothetical protein